MPASCSLFRLVRLLIIIIILILTAFSTPVLTVVKGLLFSRCPNNVANSILQTSELSTGECQTARVGTQDLGISCAFTAMADHL